MRSIHSGAVCIGLFIFCTLLHADPGTGNKKYYTNLTSARTACLSEREYGESCTSGYSPSNEHPGQNYYYRKSAYNVPRGLYYFPQSGNDCFGDLVDDGTGLCIENPYPSDAECLARPNHRHGFKDTGTEVFELPPQQLTFDYCLYTRSISQSNARCLTFDNDPQVWCYLDYAPQSSSTLSDETNTLQPDESVNANETQGGQKDTSSTSTAPVTQVDTPSTGDTTTLETMTEDITYTDQVVIDNTTTTTRVELVQGGDVQKTTTLTTVTHDDGTVTETTHVLFERAPITHTVDLFNWSNQTVSRNESTIPENNNESTTTKVTNTDGSSTITQTENEATEDRLVGDENGDGVVDCLDSGTCNTEVDDGSSANALDALYDDFTSSLSTTNVSSSDFLPDMLTIPQGPCKNLDIAHTTSSGINISETVDLCTKTQWLRDGLGWLFYMLTIVYVYKIATSSRS